MTSITTGTANSTDGLTDDEVKHLDQLTASLDRCTAAIEQRAAQLDDMPADEIKAAEQEELTAVEAAGARVEAGLLMMGQMLATAVNDLTVQIQRLVDDVVPADVEDEDEDEPVPYVPAQPTRGQAVRLELARCWEGWLAEVLPDMDGVRIHRLGNKPPFGGDADPLGYHVDVVAPRTITSADIEDNAQALADAAGLDSKCAIVVFNDYRDPSNRITLEIADPIAAAALDGRSVE